ncbi:hypothetical protein ANO11243_014360 [Dothideomycetidae sp. 11243]|nr:hypothetical protein ANO11243_014360 [fungal sp. No.11243]
MICLRCTQRLQTRVPPTISALSTLPTLRLPARSLPIRQPPSIRTLTISTLPRPTLSAQQRLESASGLAAAETPSTTSTTSTTQGPLTLVRGGKRDTYDPSHRVRKRRVGFLARMRSRTGRKILSRRKTKGRAVLSH